MSVDRDKDLSSNVAVVGFFIHFSVVTKIIKTHQLMVTKDCRRTR